MFLSPLLGFVLGFIIMAVLYICCETSGPSRVNAFFGKAQMFSAAAMGFMHGTNDAQKTMGIIALVLLAGTKAGQLRHPAGIGSPFCILPNRRLANNLEIALWIKSPAPSPWPRGTAVGGWRIIRTLGHKMVKLHPDQRICRRSQFRNRHRRRLAPGHSRFHHAQHFRLHHGRRLRQTFQRHQMDRRRAHGLGVDFHHSRGGGDRLRPGSAYANGRLCALNAIFKS